MKWRHRIGSEAMEMLLRELLETAQRMKFLKPSDMHRVTVDTTVQEKAIAFPTDGRLYSKGRELLVEKAKEEGINLRQTYSRLGPRASIMQGRYRRARQYKRAKKEEKNLKNYFGRVLRDVERKLTADQLPEWKDLLDKCHRVYEQKMADKNKLYSFHAPEVECIGKGKAHKKYEFGCKVSVVTTTRDNWVVGIQALHGNPYDGHTLAGAVTHAEIMMDGVIRLRRKNQKFVPGCKQKLLRRDYIIRRGRSTAAKPAGRRRVIDTVFADRGYRGHDYEGDAEVHLAGKKKIPRTLKRWLKRRNAIEPIIGHLKTDNGLDRNYLMGDEGDRINAILAGCGANLRKVLRAILFVPDFIKGKFAQMWQVTKNIDSGKFTAQMRAA